MTQLAFGESGDFISGQADATAKSALGCVQKGIDAIELLGQVPWMMSLLTTFASLLGPVRVFNDWYNRALELRKKVRSVCSIGL